jgi:hypothetical protein
MLTKHVWVATLLVTLGLAANGLAQPQGSIYICHFNQSTGYVLIEVPPNATSGHFDAQGNPQHVGDYISDVPSCGAATPTPTPTPGGGDPDPVPEPITMLLFGAGVAGVGYTVRKLRRKGDETEE